MGDRRVRSSLDRTEHERGDSMKATRFAFLLVASTATVLLTPIHASGG